jgi:hypothetical protein
MKSEIILKLLTKIRKYQENNTPKPMIWYFREIMDKSNGRRLIYELKARGLLELKTHKYFITPILTREGIEECQRLMEESFRR